MLLEPLVLPGALLLTVATGLFLDVVAKDIGKRSARLYQFLGQRIHLPIALVADDQALIGVEHRQAANHVIESDLEPRVQALKLLLLLEQSVNRPALSNLAHRRRANSIPAAQFIRQRNAPRTT